MKISVCMATFNGAKYIKEQLNSILTQLNKTDEIIISDDLSTDSTVEIIRELNDERIKIYMNSKNLGYSKNFENAISKSNGDIIFISDQDDVWIKGKVEKVLASLENADMVITDAEITDENLNPIYSSHFILNGTKNGFIENFLKTRYIGACMAFKRKVLAKALPFPSDYKLCAYDYWLAIIAEYYFRVDLLRIPLIKYRRHGENASSGGFSSSNSIFRKIRIRIYAMRELLKRRNFNE